MFIFVGFIFIWFYLKINKRDLKLKFKENILIYITYLFHFQIQIIYWKKKKKTMWYKIFSIFAALRYITRYNYKIINDVII